MADDPRWPRASAWLAGDHEPEPLALIAVVGAPLHLASLSPSRADLAPGAIREALRRFSTLDLELGDLRGMEARDLGDLDLAGARPEDALAPLSAAVSEALGEADVVVVLGGDNSVTRPGVHGLGLPLRRCGLLTLDAHFDLRDTGSGLTNGNPVRALLEDGLPGENVVQVGIQSFANSPEYGMAAGRAGIRVLTAEDVHGRGIETVMSEALEYLAATVEGIYLDVDLDVLDRAFAPATPGSRPGGLAPWQLRTAVAMCGEHDAVRIMDLVEVDPTRDVADVTVLTAATCLLSFASGLLPSG
ncbi:MAG: agmatinase family protein [Actinomycetota bacterium]|nr:agmatinase family protein [Actinomycetota bacterium]